MGWLARLFGFGKKKDKRKRLAEKRVSDIPDDDGQEQFLKEDLSVPDRVIAMKIKPGAAREAIKKRDAAAEKERAKENDAKKNTAEPEKHSAPELKVSSPATKPLESATKPAVEPKPTVKPAEAKPVVNAVKPAAEPKPVVKPAEAKPVVNAVKPTAEQKPAVKPAEAKPVVNAVKPAAEAKPAVKPAEAKPVVNAAKPAAEAKPVVKPAEVKPAVNAVKPAAEQKPVVKPAEVKPVVNAVKPAAEQKPAVKPAEAKPVVNAVKPAAEAKPAVNAVKPAAEAKPAVNAVKPAEVKPEEQKEPEVIEANETVKVIESKSGKSGKFDIKKSKDGRYVFNLYASNHVIVATSQVYTSSQSAVNGIRSIIANARRANLEDQTLKSYTAMPYPKWEMYIDKGGQYRFRLNAPNGSCIVHSQGYTTKSACKKGIDSIIRIAEDSEIDKSYLIK